MSLSVVEVEPSERFLRDLKSLTEEQKAAVKATLKRLTGQSPRGVLRLHNLKGYPKPTIWKVDVNSQHTHQITFEVRGNVAFLLRVGTHKQIDRDPR